MHGSELEARSGDIPVDYNKLCKRWSESAPEHERHGDSYSSARLLCAGFLRTSPHELILALG
jgi:hypothetical protein